jgi:hypothetical protein
MIDVRILKTPLRDARRALSELKVKVEPLPPLFCQTVRVSTCEEAAVA